MKTYEAIIILSNALKDENAESALERMRGEIAKLGGVVSESVVLGRREFARPLNKMESGLYARMAFQLDPAGMATLRARLRLIEDLFRIQIVKVEKPAAA